MHIETFSNLVYLLTALSTLASALGAVLLVETVVKQWAYAYVIPLTGITALVHVIVGFNAFLLFQDAIRYMCLYIYWGECVYMCQVRQGNLV